MQKLICASRVWTVWFELWRVGMRPQYFIICMFSRLSDYRFLRTDADWVVLALVRTSSTTYMLRVLLCFPKNRGMWGWSPRKQVSIKCSCTLCVAKLAVVMLSAHLLLSHEGAKIYLWLYVANRSQWPSGRMIEHCARSPYLVPATVFLKTTYSECIPRCMCMMPPAWAQYQVQSFQPSLAFYQSDYRLGIPKSFLNTMYL